MKFHLPYGDYLSALPDFLMAFAFLVTWIDPAALGENMLHYLMLVMVMEFIIIHSSAFFSVVMFSSYSTMKKTITFAVLGAFYSIFVVAFSVSSGEWWPFVVFWGMVLNRMLSVLYGNLPEGKERTVALSMWVVHTVCFIGCVFISMMIPLPQFGVTEDLIYHVQIQESGTWFNEPYRLLAFGFFYFSIIGYLEIQMEKITGIVAPVVQRSSSLFK